MNAIHSLTDTELLAVSGGDANTNGIIQQGLNAIDVSFSIVLGALATATGRQGGACHTNHHA